MDVVRLKVGRDVEAAVAEGREFGFQRCEGRAAKVLGSG